MGAGHRLIVPKIVGVKKRRHIHKNLGLLMFISLSELVGDQLSGLRKALLLESVSKQIHLLIVQLQLLHLLFEEV